MRDPIKRKAYLKAWKEKNRERLRKQNLEYYHRTKPPLKEKIVRTPDELKQMKSAENKRYREKNREKLRRKRAEYYQRNKKIINSKYSISLKNNIHKRLAHNIRNRLNQSIKRNSRYGSGISNLGCSILEFKLYIESKFLIGMSWTNYGSWHLDHIIPLCSFDLTDRKEFIKAVHYTNYQPLWATDNLVKNKYGNRGE